mmetsp:Transcript_22678/g.49092  ORF Transcript_22678/g.49092 Transcript_22678/m.49092 type:complete len:122 (-) Transcript_22678:982-1347(-)
MSCGSGIAAITALSKYILDLTLLSYHMNQEYLPSEVAAMAVFLARKCMEVGCAKKTWSGPVWSESLQYHAEYSETKLEKIAVDFIQEKKAGHDWGLRALKKKYSDVASFDKLLRLAFISLK